MANNVVVVGADALALATTERLCSCGVEVLRVGREQIADLSVSLRPGAFEVEARPVNAVLLREAIGGIPAGSFVEQDRGFVGAELSATWLAGTQLESVFAINRLDAESWFDEGWAVWHGRLERASLQVSHLDFGNHAASASRWRPYGGGGDRPVPVAAVRRTLGTALASAPLAGTALFACGEAVGETAPPAVLRAARLLRRSGLQLKSISYDAEGRLAAVDPFPMLPGELVEPVADRLTAAFYEHLRHR